MRDAAWLLIFSVALPIQAAFIREPVISGTSDIVVTGTSPTPTGFETFSISGADFSFTGTVNQLSPLYYCNFPTDPSFRAPIGICPPGWQIDPVAGDIANGGGGLNPSGNITYRGASYDYSTGPGSATQVLETHPFGLTVPNLLAPNLTLSAAFSGFANFTDPNFAGGSFFLFDSGGIVTVDLVERGNPETGFYYLMQDMHFDFTPVPEPAVALLVVTILSTLVIRSRH